MLNGVVGMTDALDVIKLIASICNVITLVILIACVAINIRMLKDALKRIRVLEEEKKEKEVTHNLDAFLDDRGLFIRRKKNK